MNKIRWGLLPLMLSLSGCWHAVEASGAPILVGLTTSLSGGTAMLGTGTKRGAAMAIDEFNAAGGYKGRPIKLVVYDDGAKPDKSVESVKSLLEKDRVVAIIGAANTGNVLAHMKMVQDAGIPEIIPGATGAKLTKAFAGPNNCIFRVSEVDSGQVKTMLDWWNTRKGIQKIAILHDMTGYGKSGRDEIMGQMSKRGLTPVAVVPYEIAQPSYATQLETVNKAAPDVIFSFGTAPDYATIIRNLTEAGMKQPLQCAWLAADPTVRRIVGPMVDRGVFTVQCFTTDMTPQAAAFHKRVVERYGEDVFPMPTAQGYDAGRLLVKAIQRGGPDAATIRNELEKIDDFEGVTATGAHPFTPENHEAINAAAMFIATYKDTRIGKAKP